MENFTMMNFDSADKTIAESKEALVNGLTDIIGQGTYKKYGETGVIEKLDFSDYSKKSDEALELFKLFASKVDARISFEDDSATGVARLLASTNLISIFNSVTAEAISKAMVRYSSPIIEKFAKVKTVDYDGVATFSYKPQQIRLLQRANRLVQPTLLNASAEGQIKTIKPKLYTDGFTVNISDIIRGNANIGEEMARCYAGVIFSQHKLIVNKIFDAARVLSTPFYAASVSPEGYSKLASALAVTTNSSVSNITAYGSRVAITGFSRQILGTSGYMLQDKLKQDGFVANLLGVNTYMVEQFMGYSAPLAATYEGLDTIVPDDRLLLVSNTDKLVALVQEDFVRVTEVRANENSQNRYEYAFTVAYDVDFISPNPQAIQIIA